MRRIAVLSLIVILFSVIGKVCYAKTSLGGLYCHDSLTRTFKVMHVPTKIIAHRGDSDTEDCAILAYIQQSRHGTAILLSPTGGTLVNIATTSPSMVTNDGLKVGDTRERIIARRGNPDDVLPGPGKGENSLWYWSQGITFSINTKNSRVASIFIFPPRGASNTTSLSLSAERRRQIEGKYHQLLVTMRKLEHITKLRE